MIQFNLHFPVVSNRFTEAVVSKQVNHLQNTSGSESFVHKILLALCSECGTAQRKKLLALAMYFHFRLFVVRGSGTVLAEKHLLSVFWVFNTPSSWFFPCSPLYPSHIRCWNVYHFISVCLNSVCWFDLIWRENLRLPSESTLMRCEMYLATCFAQLFLWCSTVFALH